MYLPLCFKVLKSSRRICLVGLLKSMKYKKPLQSWSNPSAVRMWCVVTGAGFSPSTSDSPCNRYCMSCITTSDMCGGPDHWVRYHPEFGSTHSNKLWFRVVPVQITVLWWLKSLWPTLLYIYTLMFVCLCICFRCYFVIPLNIFLYLFLCEL
jgi:hypothetical protein